MVDPMRIGSLRPAAPAIASSAVGTSMDHPPTAGAGPRVTHPNHAQGYPPAAAKPPTKRQQHCTFCKNHGFVQRKNGHTCEHKDCKCLLCQLTRMAQLAMRHQQAWWRHQSRMMAKSKTLQMLGLSSKQLCDKCRNHDEFYKKRGHKAECKFENCKCPHCDLTDKRRLIMKYQQRVRRANVTALEVPASDDDDDDKDVDNNSENDSEDESGKCEILGGSCNEDEIDQVIKAVGKAIDALPPLKDFESFASSRTGSAGSKATRIAQHVNRNQAAGHSFGISEEDIQNAYSSNIAGEGSPLADNSSSIIRASKTCHYRFPSQENDLLSNPVLHSTSLETNLTYNKEEEYQIPHSKRWKQANFHSQLRSTRDSPVVSRNFGTTALTEESKSSEFGVRIKEEVKDELSWSPGPSEPLSIPLTQQIEPPKTDNLRLTVPSFYPMSSNEKHFETDVNPPTPPPHQRYPQENFHTAAFALKHSSLVTDRLLDQAGHLLADGKQAAARLQLYRSDFETKPAAMSGLGYYEGTSAFGRNSSLLSQTFSNSAEYSFHRSMQSDALERLHLFSKMFERPLHDRLAHSTPISNGTLCSSNYFNSAGSGLYTPAALKGFMPPTFLNSHPPPLPNTIQQPSPVRFFGNDYNWNLSPYKTPFFPFNQSQVPYSPVLLSRIGNNAT